MHTHEHVHTSALYACAYTYASQTKKKHGINKEYTLFIEKEDVTLAVSSNHICTCKRMFLSTRMTMKRHGWTGRGNGLWTFPKHTSFLSKWQHFHKMLAIKTKLWGWGKDSVLAVNARNLSSNCQHPLFKNLGRVAPWSGGAETRESWDSYSCLKPQPWEAKSRRF